jgi:hypothetical protein
MQKNTCQPLVGLFQAIKFFYPFSSNSSQKSFNQNNDETLFRKELVLIGIALLLGSTGNFFRRRRSQRCGTE